MRPHDETVRAAIEQSLGSTLKTLCEPASGLFVRRRELWETTLTALQRWSPALAEQLSSDKGFAPIATVSLVVSNAEEGTPAESKAAKVVTAVVLEDGPSGAPPAATAKKEKGAEGVVFAQPSNAAGGEADDEEGCVVQ